MGYNSEFKINPDQLQMIEDALRAEIGRLASPRPNYISERCSNQEEAKKIRDLLGHLHNQKHWYYPKEETVPMG